MFDFQTVSDNDLLKAKLFNKARMSASGCWEWLGPQDGKGYGLTHMKSKTMRAHRVSYQAFVGPIPAGLVICHACDNPICINPNHLRADTMKANTADREARGRRDVRGEQVGTAKLTADQVREIRNSNLGLTALGAKYGVDRSNVWAIRAGRSWKHVGAHAHNGVDGA